MQNKRLKLGAVLFLGLGLTGLQAMLKKTVQQMKD
jgi:Tfp pilus assembly protein PilV